MKRGRPPLRGERKMQINLALSPAIVREVERRKAGSSRSATVESMLWRSLECENVHR